MQNQKLNIAIYSGEVPSTTFIERLINGLSDRGHNIYLFGIRKDAMTYPGNVLDISYKKGKFFKLVFLIKYMFLLLVFKSKSKKRLDEFLKEGKRNTLNEKVKCYPVLWHKPDIFHVQWAKGLKDWVWVKEFEIKLVLSLRGAHINYSPIADKYLAKEYKELFPKVDVFHAVSKAIAKEASKYGAIANRTKVIYSGLNTDYNANKEKPKNEMFKIVSVGRSHWKKGYQYSIDAMKMIFEEGFEFQYDIIGAVDDLELRYHIQDLNLMHLVNLNSKMSHKSTLDKIFEADLLLLPSVEEGIANVVLEAMSQKTIVLSTNCGGLEEVIEDAVTGYLVPMRNTKAMAKKVIEIIRLNDSSKDEIRNNALIKIQMNFNKKQMIDGMESLYRTISN